MVRIRMSRLGRPHRPFFRINAVDQRTKRDGKVIENLGWYDPMTLDEAKRMMLKTDRIQHWLNVGAQPSDTLMNLFIKQELITGERAESWRSRQAKRVAQKAAAAPAAEGEKKE